MKKYKVILKILKARLKQLPVADSENPLLIEDKKVLKGISQLGFYIIPFEALHVLLEVPQGISHKNVLQALMIGEMKRKEFQKKKIAEALDPASKRLATNEYEPFMKLFKRYSVTSNAGKQRQGFTQGFDSQYKVSYKKEYKESLKLPP